MSKIRPSTQIAQDGATTSQVLTWDGTKWTAQAAAGGAPTGAAGGDLAGTYPNPTLTTSGVTAGSYTSANVTVDAKGRVTAASNGGGGMTDPTTTKGDLIVHGATTTRLPVGTNAQVLTADSTQAAGVAWTTPGYLAVLWRATGGSWQTTTSTTAADLDATNLVITFTTPASGKVLVTLETPAFGGASNGLIWSLREGATTVIESGVTADGGSTADWVRCRTTFLVTGLTAGSSHTYKWGWRASISTNSVGTYSGATPHAALMAVQDAGSNVTVI